MALFSFDEGWVCFRRCLERVRERADASLVPGIGSGLHIWAGVSNESPVANWNMLLQQVGQRLKLNHFSLEALKDFPTLAWDSMMVAAARSGGEAAYRMEKTARKLVRQVLEDDATADRITSAMQDRYRMFAQLPWRHVISLNFDCFWAKYGLQSSSRRLPGYSNTIKERTDLRYRISVKKSLRRITVWYPHGALGLSDSVCLGLRDYGGLMPQANAAFSRFKKWESSHFSKSATLHSLTVDEWRPVREKLQGLLAGDQPDPSVSSVSLMLTHPLIFLGCGLSRSEWGLWWVLNQRQRNLVRVNHHDPSVFALMCSKNRNELWNSRPAGVVPLWCDKWDVGWQRVFDLTSGSNCFCSGGTNGEK